ncbi:MULTISPECIES: hypothetical protein [unclassified Okeania]|uniref:hypothetical protein n=1 Tax=unclassified Okeania TaxID=2634635 RepID=UPI0013B70F1D|nr:MULTISPECIES: hypothetical protein [unclassified Okeania]NES77303.1 hypothetical protein [Okeania sp. SIO1H4]NET15188.1 hypothetical protein [Okeania sp. SIO1H6]NET18137.1 hypothetical protein [Okeania sp. SIO1H5]NET93965.1 hypothetical protein [Okeania sp. SIO1H2]
MSKVYSTIELIDILAEERQACLQGQRLNLAATPRTGNPVVDHFLKPEAFQKFTAYQDFKAAVHRYQTEYLVSGIVWRQVTVNDKIISFPVVHEQLIALLSDLEILQAAKVSVLNFWSQVTVGMDLYLSVGSGRDFRKIEIQEVEAIAQRTEWANMLKWEKSNFLEMLLQLGWGKPELAAYRRGWPNSGSEYIHAVKPGKQPIC